MNIDERLSLAAQSVDEQWADPARTARRYAKFLTNLTHQNATLGTSASSAPGPSPDDPQTRQADAAEKQGDSSPGHGTTCGEVLDHLYELLDNELSDGDSADLRKHLEECSSCLENYGVAYTIKRLVKRTCGYDDVPTDLRAKVLGRIEMMRAGLRVVDEWAVGGDAASPVTTETATQD
ncbi:mycothiol system anti-sigma-R factor [Streptomyces sp. NPDC001549]|uniref:mycothiol system anti-sigma-R factor n=1 Tax=Streptomyces sp. NPDC001549 TaxID=3364586 RepID=UPI0036C8DE42